MKKYLAAFMALAMAATALTGCGGGDSAGGGAVHGGAAGNRRNLQ